METQKGELMDVLLMMVVCVAIFMLGYLAGWKDSNGDL